MIYVIYNSTLERRQFERPDSQNAMRQKLAGEICMYDFELDNICYRYGNMQNSLILYGKLIIYRVS